MTTKLTKPIAREVTVRHHEPMIVTLTESGVQFRTKGRRTSYLLPYGLAFQRAATIEADAARGERLGRARAPRVARGLLGGMR